MIETVCCACVRVQGEVVALDRIRSKMASILQNVAAARLTCVKTYCFDSTQALTSDPTLLNTGGTDYYYIIITILLYQYNNITIIITILLYYYYIIITIYLMAQ